MRKFIFTKNLVFCAISLLISTATFADYTIPAGTTVDASTLTGETGQLTIYGTLNVSTDVALTGFTYVIISGSNAQIFWTNNSNLTFAKGIPIVVTGSALGLQPTTGNGNGSQRLLSGDVIVAVSSDHANNSLYSFEQFNGIGGLTESAIEAGALPVTFVSVKAFSKNENVSLEWKVENESEMKGYRIERSVDGRNFSQAGEVVALNRGAATYQWSDVNTKTGYNYFRIASVSIDGKVSYTEVIKVMVAQANSGIAVYPNPVSNGVINLQLKNKPAGKYGIRLINSNGQTVITKTIQHAAGSSKEPVYYDQLNKGIYQLEVADASGHVETVRVVRY